MPPITPLNFNFRDDSKRFLKPKSDRFVAVQTALDTYVLTSTPANLLALTAALGTWKRTKQHGQQNWTGSIRAAQVQQLDAWLIAESQAQGIFPAPEAGWNGSHNCYAYAMKCLGGPGTRPQFMARAAGGDCHRRELCAGRGERRDPSALDRADRGGRRGSGSRAAWSWWGRLSRSGRHWSSPLRLPTRLSQRFSPTRSSSGAP